MFFFFSSRRRHTRCSRDWSSDVCSSDLGHTTYSNSLAFRNAGIDEKTPDPPGGKIDRDRATGKPSGRVAESANALFEKVIPSHFSRDDFREGVKLISKMLAKTGITSAHEAQGTPDDLRAYQDA